MKVLNYEMMECVSGGSIAKELTCISQVTSGMSTLGFLAGIGIFATTPIGWGLFALSVISLAAGVAADPTACD